MNMFVRSLLISCLLCQPLMAQSPLQQWVLSKGFKVRLNPNGSSLVGEIYPSDNINLGNRIARMENCWPPEFVSSFKAGGFRHNAAHSEIVNSARGTDINTFLRFARKTGAGSDADLKAIQAELSARNARSVSIEAVDTFETPIAALDVLENFERLESKRRKTCLDAVQDNRNIVVLNALGITRLSYSFVDDDQKKLAVSTNLARLLFNIGISKDERVAGTVEFSEPVYVGFQISRWCAPRNAFLGDREKCK